MELTPTPSMKMEKLVVRSSESVTPSSRPIGERDGTGMEAVRVLVWRKRRRPRGGQTSCGLK